MFQHRLLRNSLYSQNNTFMHNSQRSHPSEILFEDQVTLSDGCSKPYHILLQLTTESLIIRPYETTSIVSLNNTNTQIPETRHVIIIRQPVTRSFGFSIKGGRDTGFPILISRVVERNSHVLNIGDRILNINNVNTSNLTHDQVIKKLRDLPDDQVQLTIKYMNNMATYLHLTSQEFRSSLSILQNYLTMGKILSNRITRDQKSRSALYSCEYHSNMKQIYLPLTTLHKQKNINGSTVDVVNNNIKEYSLLYAYVSQYINGTDEWRMNAFQLHTINGYRTGIIITSTSIEQNMWISRINTVIQSLTTRLLAEFNQILLPYEQVFYATWIHERVIHHNKNHLPTWKAIFTVFKGNNLYIFDNNQLPPLCTYDFICCPCVYPVVEIFIQTVISTNSIDNHRYCITLILPNSSTNQYRYLSLERKIEYDDFILNYQRSLYISVYSIQSRTFGCIYHGQICRLIIDINKGFEMYNNRTNIILWAFTFEQLQSTSDDGRNKIYFHFKRNMPLNETAISIHMEVQCLHLRILVHVINSFLTVKFITQQDYLIDHSQN